MNDHYRKALPDGFEINEFVLERVLGIGGFGITYLARDTDLEREVAIKEHLPSQFASRDDNHCVQADSLEDEKLLEWSLTRFDQEARTLAKLNHNSVIKVHRRFRKNNTSYMAMEYAQGQDFKKFLDSRKEKPLTQEETEELLRPLLDGLEKVHQQGILHRDIKPANIFLRDADGSPVLLDFGAARNAMGTRSKSIFSLLTEGYAPPEQYSIDGNQGHWTDIYALGAVLYRIIAGKTPCASLNRMRHDPLLPAVRVGQRRFSRQFLEAVDWALMVYEEERPQEIAAWREALFGETEAKTPPPPPLPSDISTAVSPPPSDLDSERPTEVRRGDASRPKRPVPAGARQPSPRQAPRQAPQEPTQQEKPPEPTAPPPLLRRKYWTEPSTGMRFIWIPSGRFKMGSPESEMGRLDDEGPQHEVSLDGFWLGKHPVTQEEWATVMRHNPSHFRLGGNNPVEMVSWNDAQEFIKAMNRAEGGGFRLPTEAEWEYACRAGTTTPFSFGDTLSADTQANYDGNFPYWGGPKGPYRAQTTPVNQFPGNRFGLHDMHGNVWEWVQDWYDEAFYRQSPAVNPHCENPESGRRILRGGSWYFNARNARCAFRIRNTPDFRSWNFGFRMARTARD